MNDEVRFDWRNGGIGADALRVGEYELRVEDWREKGWVAGREWNFGPKVPTPAGPHKQMSVRGLIEAAEKRGLSRVDVETMCLKPRQLSHEEFKKTYDMGGARDIWWLEDKHLIPKIPNCLKPLWARVLLQAASTARRINSIQAWDLAFAVPFLVLQRWPKCRIKSISTINTLAARFIRFIAWDIQELAREAAQLMKENTED